MHKLALFLLLFPALQACTAGRGGPPFPSGPELEIASTRFDFGSVRAGEEVRHVFEIGNVGSGPLTLEAAASACACAIEIGASGVVAAGASAPIAAVFDTSGLSGAQRRRFSLHTNDPSVPVLELFMHGEVRADVSWSPDRIFFGRMRAGERRESTVDVATGPGVSVRKIRRGSQALGLRVEPLPSPGSGIRVHVALIAPRRLGAFEEELVLFTNSEQQATLRIPVLAWVE